MPRQQPRRRLPDLRNAERVDRACERDAAVAVAPGDQLVGADLAPTFTLCDDPRIKAEDVARLADQLILPESGDVLLTEPFDVEAVARHEMLQPFDRLRRTDQAAGAAPGSHAFLAHREAAADRAAVGELVGRGVFRPAVAPDSDGRLEHVARALDHD